MEPEVTSAAHKDTADDWVAMQAERSL